jgi:hypothetical protein
VNSIEDVTVHIIKYGHWFKNHSDFREALYWMYRAGVIQLSRVSRNADKTIYIVFKTDREFSVGKGKSPIEIGTPISTAWPITHPHALEIEDEYNRR